MDSGNIDLPIQSTQLQQQPKNDDTHIQSLARQSSIYSLTLDEFQNTLSENGKNFGSMNMDEFLASVWTAEENQNQSQASVELAQGSSSETGNNPYGTAQRTENALLRQASLSLPATLSLKTVDEVWTRIHEAEQTANNYPNSHVNPNPMAVPVQRQTTFGDMTLEDFLVRAGVVTAPQNFAPYGGMMHQQNMGFNVVHSPVGAAAFAARSPMMGMDVGNVVNYQAGMMYQHQPPTPVVGYGSEGFGVPGQGTGVESPESPASSGGPIHINFGNKGGQKRTSDGPVTERRQRRMIKNRESAARSRARKMAYTVEIEAELNQLKEENEQLKHALVNLMEEYERNRRRQYNEVKKPETPTQSKAQKVNEKLRAMRRTSSCHY